MVGPRLPSSARTAPLSTPKVYGIKLFSTYKIFRCRDLSCCQDTVYWAAGLRSAGTSFCRAICQLYRDHKLTAVNWDSPIYRDYPICQLYRDPKHSAVNRDYPIWQLCLDTETFSHLQGLYLYQKASSRLPGFCKNSCQLVPLSATN